MQREKIASEIVREIPRENILSLIQQFASGYGYWTAPVFPKDGRKTSEISLFAKDDATNEKKLLPGEVEGFPPRLATVLITPLPPNMRVEISCNVDWQEAYAHLGNTPCDLASGIIRYLLRLIEGDTRADVWQPIDNRVIDGQPKTEIPDTAVSEQRDFDEEKGRKFVELLYWLSVSCNFDRLMPANLWANEQFHLNWGLAEEEWPPCLLHYDIPNILHELMESAFLADYPENWPIEMVDGIATIEDGGLKLKDYPLPRFWDQERHNGGRIIREPPFSFQIYVTSYGLKHVDKELRKGELGKKRNQNGDIEWGKIETIVTENTRAHETSGIASSLYSQLNTILLECDIFDNDKELSAIFVDEKINQWRDQIPQANTRRKRVEGVAEYLYRQQNDKGENALVLFLHVLGGRYKKEDAYYQQLIALANKLERE